LLDEAKIIVFPESRSGYAKAQKLELFESSLGSFTGNLLSLHDSNFSISKYLTGNGLFPSRVKFYLLTTAKIKDTLDNIGSSCESVKQLGRSFSSSNATNDDGVRSATDSGVEQEVCERLDVGDSKKSFVIEFCRHEISHYTSDLSSLFIVVWFSGMCIKRISSV
jgi:hypothetical protein